MSDHSLIQKLLLLPFGNRNFVLSALQHFAKMNVDTAKLSHTQILEALWDNAIFRKRLPTLSFKQQLTWENKYKWLIEENEKNNIKTVSYLDENYPKALHDLVDSPILLNYKGNFEKLNSLPSVAVVGSRQPTDYGYRIGVRVGEVLADHQVGVISGLALGCDTAGHQGAINKDGFTCAVLAHGLHEIYPKENIALAQNILDKGGLLLTESNYGECATKYSFLERNRIQAGLSKVVVVIETAEKSGTIHTVNTTIKLERFLYCIKPPEQLLKAPSIQGNIKLLEQDLAYSLGTREEFEKLLHILKS